MLKGVVEMIIDSLNKMLEMAEWFKAHGETELYNKTVSTVNRILDLIMFHGRSGRKEVKP